MKSVKTRSTAIILSSIASLFLIACKTQPSAKSDASSDATAAADAGNDGALADLADGGAHVYKPPPPVPPPPGARDVEKDPPPTAKSPRPTDWSDAEDLKANGTHPCSA